MIVMSLFSWLDRWDEERAAIDDAAKRVETVEVGASLAFEDAPVGAGLDVLQQLVAKHCGRAGEYYASPRPLRTDFTFDGELLTFQSAIRTESPESDLVCARVIEKAGRRGAVIVLPHWSAPTWGYQRFVRHLSRVGLTAVEVALPYHGVRMRDGALIADHFLSANLGRTIRSVRQAVVDTIDIVTWLTQRGHDRIAVIGLSLGSCIAGLVGAHDPRVRCSALFLTAGDFAEVTWTGRATRHIRRAVETEMTLDQLRSVWSIISTETFAREFARPGHDALVISGTRDTVVKPYLTRRFIDQLNASGARFGWTRLGCGHYSLARAPFSILAFLRLLYFFQRCGLFRKA
jgi:hypothetical protein